MSHGTAQAPLALVTLRAHQPAPARVELLYKPLPGRLVRALLCLLVFWGALPFLIWIPPHYPWVTVSFVTGLFLAHRQWTGRYRVRSFAGICPRCGAALSMGVDHAISLPHTLTCYRCHFEPRLEVRFAEPAEAQRPARPEHQRPECTGVWEVRWLADEPFIVCTDCHAGCPATPLARRVADEENLRAALLARLADEGRTML
jgi:hypothetical protein